MKRLLIALVVIVMTTSARGDDQPSLPKPPDGWKAVTAKDGSSQFFFPADAPRSGSRE
jgi:hypothetical protein